MNMTKAKLMMIWGMLLLSLACATTARQPYLETIVPESKEPRWFRLSPDRRKMLYRAQGYYVLNLDTEEKTKLSKLSLTRGPSLRWVDNRYIYSRVMGDDWQEYPRQVVDTETWEVHPIAEFSPQEQTRIEQEWRGGGIGHISGQCATLLARWSLLLLPAF